MEIISKYRGNTEWAQRGDFFYTASRHREETTTYTCSATNCKAYFNVKRGVLGEIKKVHVHNPEPWIPNRNQMYQNLKQRSCDEGLDFFTIYAQEALRYPDAAPYLDFNSVVSNMKTCRKRAQPDLPHSLADYAESLQVHPQHNTLLIDIVHAPSGGSAVILGAPGYVDMLRSAQTILADGTFKTVPAGIPAAQILTIHCSINGHYFHPIVALMAHRRRDLYMQVFQRVWDLTGHPQPTHIITDFERALQSAMTLVAGLPINGCFFHYTQALIRKAKSIGIPTGNESPGLILIRLYCALALLPPDRVPDAVAQLPRIARSEHLPFNAVFHDYFVDFWMIQITPEGFTAHGRTHRTTNIAESYHSRLSNIIGANANVWTFTQKMSESFAYCQSRRRTQQIGRPLSKRNREKHLKYARSITNHVRELNAGTMTVRGFLMGVSSRLVGVQDDVVAAADVPEVAEEVEVAYESDDDDDAEMDIPLPAAPPAAPPAPSAAPLAPPAAPPAAPAPAGPRCGICLEEPPTRVLIPCGHTLCDSCLIGIQESGLDMRDRCPYCRTHISSCIIIYL